MPRTDGDTLRLHGALTLERAADVLAEAPTRFTVLDLEAVEDIDSAGVALVAELVCRAEHSTGRRPEVRGRPPGLQALCAAYRIDTAFRDFP